MEDPKEGGPAAADGFSGSTQAEILSEGLGITPRWAAALPALLHRGIIPLRGSAREHPNLLGAAGCSPGPPAPFSPCKGPLHFSHGSRRSCCFSPLCPQGTQFLSVPRQNYEAGCLWGGQVTLCGPCLSFPIDHKRISALPGCFEVHK